MDPTKLIYNLDLSEKSTWLTVTTPPAIKSSFAFVQELGDFHCGADYFTSRENLPSYLILLCLSGEGVLEYEKKTNIIKPGNLFWIDCKKQQRYYTSQEKSNWHSLWVHLYGPTAGAYHDMFVEQNRGSVVVGHDPYSPLVDIYKALLSLYMNGSGSLQSDIQASNLLTQLMTGCVQTANDLPFREKKPDFVSSVQAYINENYQQEVTLDCLAQYFSINKYHLQKYFKRYTGLSPNDYLTRIRLDRAKRLLRTTSDPVIEIAHEVGYTVTYFDNIFKKYEGVTPRSYRQHWYDSANKPTTN